MMLSLHTRMSGMRETERTTGVRWTSVHTPQWNQRKNKEQLDSLGMKCEGDGGQDVGTSGRNQKER